MPVDEGRLRIAVQRLADEKKLPAEIGREGEISQDFLNVNLGHVSLQDPLGPGSLQNAMIIQETILRIIRERNEATEAIQKKRDQFSFFGDPTSELSLGSDGRGYVQHFQSGSIFWLPGLGAHEVHGAIRDKYSSLGWESSFLRYPMTDELSAGEVRYSNFEGGTIQWTAASGAFIELSLRSTIERHQLGAWVHMFGEGYTPGGTVRFSVRGLEGFAGDKSTGTFCIAKADGTFSDVIWDGRTWPRGGTAEMVASDQSSGRSATAHIPALY